MTYPARVLSQLLANNATSPRLTVYDAVAAAAGYPERIELSAQVFANWVSKAANALQDDGVGPDDNIIIDLPPHWRSAYWAFAAWSVGAGISLDAVADAAAVITADTEVAGAAARDGRLTMLVTLPALMTHSPHRVPSGAVDEAAELSSYPDQFAPLASPQSHATALAGPDLEVSFGELSSWAPHAPLNSRVFTCTASTASFLQQLLSAWQVNGSMVLARGDSYATRSSIVKTEGITLEL